MMDRFAVKGGYPLAGEVRCSGSKNATLPLMSAALLVDGVTVLQNVPDLQDIRTMAMVLKVIGADVHLDDGKLNIDSSGCNSWEAPYELVRKMRASFYVLGPLMARFGRARISLPGGCALGPRPVDLHLKALQRMGCEISIEAGYVNAETKGLKGARVDLDFPSVGATGNIIMAAVAADGVTEIFNAACEPEIVDLADCLSKMGADIHGAGTPNVMVAGPGTLHPITWEVIPDRIETATLALAGAITRGQITISGCQPDHLILFLEKLKDTGAEVEIGSSTIRVDARERRLNAVDVTTAVYPGFATDIQAPWTSLMCTAHGDSIITDTVYPERFNHVPELNRLGASISQKLNTIHVRGINSLKGTSVMCSDIRAAAALVLAALTAEGHSDVLRVYHLDRGYEGLEQKLVKIGADIRRIRE